jgi:hypothetical protein
VLLLLELLLELLPLLMLLHTFALSLGVLQPPFTLSKIGPSTVTAGQAFDYNLVVAFLGSATGVVVVDDLPVQLTATGSPATWKSVTVNGSNPSGGERYAAAF